VIFSFRTLSERGTGNGHDRACGLRQGVPQSTQGTQGARFRGRNKNEINTTNGVIICYDRTGNWLGNCV
jgi:hypothetical protein